MLPVNHQGTLEGAMFSHKTGLAIACALLCALELIACKEQTPQQDEKPGPMITDEKGVRRFVSEEAAKNALPTDIPPASCAEWATQSSPQIQDPRTKCKVLGGAQLCYRVTGTHSGTYDIGPIVGQTKVGQPITVHFRVRNFGSGDSVIYSFGKVDWGDGSQQDIAPFVADIPLTHTYTSARLYTVNAMAGQQFKYQAGPTSGSYEGCVDKAIPMNVLP
jgi:hypothetical protein